MKYLIYILFLFPFSLTAQTWNIECFSGFVTGAACPDCPANGKMFIDGMKFTLPNQNVTYIGRPMTVTVRSNKITFLEESTTQRASITIPLNQTSYSTMFEFTQAAIACNPSHVTGDGIERFPGTSAPVAPPSIGMSDFLINDDNFLYYYNFGAWHCLNCVASSNITFQEGAGIEIQRIGDVVTITNEGDLSNSNELNTSFSIAGPNIQLTDPGGNLTIPIISIAPVQDITPGAGINITGTTNKTIVNTGDLSNTNEIQTLSLSGQNLSLSSGGGIVAIPGLHSETLAANVLIDGFFNSRNLEFQDIGLLRFNASGMVFQGASLDIIADNVIYNSSGEFNLNVGGNTTFITNGLGIQYGAYYPDIITNPQSIPDVEGVLQLISDNAFQTLSYNGSTYILGLSNGNNISIEPILGTIGGDVQGTASNASVIGLRGYNVQQPNFPADVGKIMVFEENGGDGSWLLFDIPSLVQPIINSSLDTFNPMNWPLLAPNGDEIAPSYSFANATSTGMFLGDKDLTIFGGNGKGVMISTANQTSKTSSDIHIGTGGSEDGETGAINIVVGNSTNGGGGGVTIGAGESGLGQGGGFQLRAGLSTGSQGGNFDMFAGSSGSGPGGNFNMSAGNSADAEGGDVVINPGAGVTRNGRVITYGEGIVFSNLVSIQVASISSPQPGQTIFCSDCTANDSSNGVLQTYNGATWKNHW